MHATKQRAREIGMERRPHWEDFAPAPSEDPALTASECVLGNDNLQPGDIVLTKGLSVFHRKTDQPRSNEDFLPLQPR